MTATIFSSPKLRIACISDTHNDDCRQQIPSADIFIHAGDMTNDGTFQELEAAFSWITSLPHKLKIVVAGNHDRGLDRSHLGFSQQALELFTSVEAVKNGIQYLDCEQRVVAYISSSSGGKAVPVRVYGNPRQPDFLRSSYAFTYPPAPSDGAEDAWKTAPSRDEGVDLWVMHSSPKDRLDFIPLPPLTGCVVQAQKIAAARPLLCVFGHYHYSHGAETVRWREDSDEVDKATKLDCEARQEFDFGDSGKDEFVEKGKTTVFVNAAWMTMDKRTKSRNSPLVVSFSLSAR